MIKFKLDKPEIIKLYITLEELEHIDYCLDICGLRGMVAKHEGCIHEMTRDTITKKLIWHEC